MIYKSLLFLAATSLVVYPVTAQNLSEYPHPATDVLASRNSQEELSRSKKLEAIAQLRPTQRLRIEVLHQALIEGYFHGFTGDTLYLVSEKDIKPIMVDSMSGLWVLGTAPGRGAILGGVLGGTIAAFVVWLIDDTDNNGQDNVRSIGIAVAAGITVGTLVGFIPFWQRRYP